MRKQKRGEALSETERGQLARAMELTAAVIAVDDFEFDAFSRVAGATPEARQRARASD